MIEDLYFKKILNLCEKKYKDQLDMYDFYVDSKGKILLKIGNTLEIKKGLNYIKTECEDRMQSFVEDFNNSSFYSSNLTNLEIQNNLLINAQIREAEAYKKLVKNLNLFT
jgi:hypothetical protein